MYLKMAQPHLGRQPQIRPAKMQEHAPLSKNSFKSLTYLKAVFICVVGLLLLLVAATPLLVHGGIALSDRFVFEEDLTEAVLIAVLLSLAYLMSRAYHSAVAAYKRKLVRLSEDKKQLTDRLTDIYRYVGSINVQLQEINAVFSRLKRLPENRRQFKHLLSLFGNKILGMVNTDWVTIRIFDRRFFRTIVEHREVRLTCRVAEKNIGNRTVVEGKDVNGCVVVKGAKDNLPIVATCILPVDHLDKQETILLQTLVDEIELLFIISNLYPRIKDEMNKL
jgi:hypothetical protein